jgi:hypothetical protein
MTKTKITATIPISDHPYHRKSDTDLRYIIRDAAEAAQVVRGHDDPAEAKYLDQVNDAVTILNYRRSAASNHVRDLLQVGRW